MYREKGVPLEWTNRQKGLPSSPCLAGFQGLARWVRAGFWLPFVSWLGHICRRVCAAPHYSLLVQAILSHLICSSPLRMHLPISKLVSLQSFLHTMVKLIFSKYTSDHCVFLLKILLNFPIVCSKEPLMVPRPSPTRPLITTVSILTLSGHISFFRNLELARLVLPAAFTHLWVAILFSSKYHLFMKVFHDPVL